jgi:archaellum component FlaC
MWGQRSSCYAAAVGTHFLAKLHQLQNTVENMDCHQNHPLDRLDEHVDFMGEAANKLGWFIDELNSHMDTQDVQIDQLATMVKNLIGKTEKQQKEIKNLKSNCEMQCKIINTLTAKVIALEQCMEDVCHDWSLLAMFLAFFFLFFAPSSHVTQVTLQENKQKHQITR